MFRIPAPKQPIHAKILAGARNALGLNGKPKVDGLPSGPDPETVRKCDEALRSIRQISREEAVRKISGVTSDWNDLTARLLRMPPTLYIMEQTSGISLSPDRHFDVTGVEDYLVESWNPDLQFPKLPAYGIGLSGSGSTYITLVDMSRSIVVRERAFSEHEPGESRWTKFSNAIKAAATRAEGMHAKENGMVVVYNDGFYETRQL